MKSPMIPAPTIPVVPSSTRSVTARMPWAAAAALLLTGCATEPTTTLGDGSSVRELVAQQTHDTSASARHGTTTPQGSDPDVVNAAVEGVRAPPARGMAPSSRASMLDVIGGSGSR